MRRRESGSILVVTLLGMLVLFGMGLLAMWVASSQTKIAGSVTRRQEALAAAESGIERARVVLRDTFLPWSFYTMVGCGASHPTKGMVLCDVFGVTPLQRVQVATLPLPTAASIWIRYTIYIRNDDAEGDANVAGGLLPRELDANRRVVVRVEGQGSDAVSGVAVEVVLNMSGPLTAPVIESWREARD